VAVNEITTTQPGCGKTLDELSDYLSHDRIPFDATIETCPECLNTLDALERLGQLSRDLLAEEADDQPPLPDSWIGNIMTNIQREMRAGRSLPLEHPDPRVAMTVTEGALRALVRAAGDSVTGILIGKCDITGDVEAPGAAITVTVTASLAWGQSGPLQASRVRARIYDALSQHTTLNIAAVDVTIHDIHNTDTAARNELQ
jgi:uncharacterized alkaline shock family protein YloU